MILHADSDLAYRIEMIAASEMREFAVSTCALYPELGATWMTVGVGNMGFYGPDSAVNGAMGIGMGATVAEADLVAVERFFRDHGVRPALSACPLADASLAHWLSARGWVVSGFENVLALRLGDDFPEPHDAIEIRIAQTPEDLEAWAELVAVGFSAPELPTPAEYQLGRAAVAIPGRSFLTAHVDGKHAGTGELRIHDGVGWLSADTTLPQYRGRGVQQSLQRARLAMAREAGCDLAVTESAPGSGSQRNMERIGFQVVYTRVDAAAPSAVVEL